MNEGLNRLDGEPVWDQTTINRLWVTTHREAMIESGPPPAAVTSSQPARAKSEEGAGEKVEKGLSTIQEL